MDHGNYLPSRRFEIPAKLKRRLWPMMDSPLERMGWQKLNSPRRLFRWQALRLALGWLILGGCAANLRAASFTTIFDHGPSANRVDLAFLGDGYTEADLGFTYSAHIGRMLRHMFQGNQDPFPRYQNFFNVHQVEVVSEESGADVPPQGIFRDTALDASYYFDGATERLLYISNSKVNQVLSQTFTGTDIDVDATFVTVNDSRYGGGGGRSAVYAGGNVSSPELALHEFGHSFSDLADEYGGSTQPYTGSEPREVNVTTSPNGEKWAHWLGYEQPGIGVIGAYEGGRYFDQGIYRPSLDSKMRSLDRPFDAVSREKFILDIYEHVDPLDAWLSTEGTLVDPEELWIDVVDPEVISVEWFLDGELLEIAFDETLELEELRLEPGNYTLSARAFDPTDWVRIQRELLEQTVSWAVSITRGPPLIPGDANGDGSVDLTDFAIVKDHFGTGTTLAEGDFNGDLVVDLLDFSILKENFGQESPATPVPEPATLWLALAAGLVGSFARRV